MNKIAEKLTDLALEDHYDTVDNDPIAEFLVPALAKSTKYFRAVGYFSSAILAVLAESFTDFAERGGKMRLVCSPFLSVQDAQVLEQLTLEGYKNSLNGMLDGLDREGVASEPMNLMAKLVQMGALEIKIAVPKAGTVGLFHQKNGFFEDVDGNKVAFEGSNNETLSAWAKNYNSESFTVYPNWGDKTEKKHAERIEGKFARFWIDDYLGFDFVDFNSSLNFIQRRENESSNLAEIKANVREWVKEQASTSKEEDSDHSKVVLRDYQEAAIADWVGKNYQGVISFATGAGKTITALAAMENWFQRAQPAGVLVLVPSVRLQKQWISEIARHPSFRDVRVLPVGGIGISTVWKTGLHSFSKGLVENSRTLVIAVMDSASTPAFRSRISWGEHLLVVADEMHNLGAPGFSSLLEDVNAGGLLGLSATPSRYDEQENQRIRTVFGEDLNPVIDIREAQRLDVLVNYIYLANKVRLSSDEAEAHEALTKEINKIVAIKQGSKPLSRSMEMQLKKLSMSRARLLKKAQSKIPAAVSILRENFEPDDHWLIFLEDSEQLDAFKEKIRDLKPFTLHQGMDGDADATLAAYAEQGGILLAIQMMDEGVDVPEINKSIIISSSQNPRQYIQRRGRILRKDRNRAKVARIWDFVVIDDQGYALNDAEVFRCTEFAKDAINSGSVIEYEMLRKPTAEKLGRK